MNPPVVIDTNCVLDLWVFADPAAQPLRAALESGALRWLATGAMRGELARVLAYPQIAARLPPAGAASVLAAFDAQAQLTAPAPAAPVRCRDRDDQPFIDLAVAWRATLCSKDAALLKLARPLAALGVTVRRGWTLAPG